MKAELYNYKCWLGSSDKNEIIGAVKKAIDKSELEILGFMEHKFVPHGFTAIWLLGESHLAIHTYPENEDCYLELTSCNVRKNKIFIQTLEKYFSVTGANSAVSLPKNRINNSKHI